MDIAAAAHRGQVDKAGNPYLHHPARVAEAVWAATGNLTTTAVALLHDVIEDGGHTVDSLRNLGMPSQVAYAVDSLSRRKGETPEDYYARVRSNRTAHQVKYYDIADNTDPSRLAHLDGDTRDRLTRKYAKALALLDIDDGPDEEEAATLILMGDAGSLLDTPVKN